MQWKMQCHSDLYVFYIFDLYVFYIFKEINFYFLNYLQHLQV